ncbi:F0F1 ATP synthase subunit epsilon [Chrysiogenes arsenatis]|uniref:F0F1 ATP synthase subunit epsilon n=1 Tax=Chrysiogenes arsenatis TaxID=309797 RepID=UPI000411758A|nr:F0F1 ATP synthase subunit epsilon [Chrysiogenes arsenatis]
MAETIGFELITPQKQLLKLDVEQVSMTGIEGDFTVLPNHTPFLTALKLGELTYVVDGKETHVFVDWGFCEVLPHQVTVLAETSELAIDIDIEEARNKKMQVEEVLQRAEYEDTIAFERARVELIRQIMRISIAEKYGR